MRATFVGSYKTGKVTSMKPSVQIERLTQLIRVLEEVKADKKPFDMHTWFRVLYPGWVELSLVGNKTHTCGTASCAAGWAAQDPWFKRRGFTLTASTPDWHRYGAGEKTVHMRGDGTEFDACESFFGVRDLFSPCDYVDFAGRWLKKITPFMVITKVKKLIKSLEAGVGVS